MADHLEIEQKFDVDEGFVRPDFGGRIDGVAAAEPVTTTSPRRTSTRRRSGSRRTRSRCGAGPAGTDQGWHLKLPAGEGARRELQAPLGDPGDDTVPERLAAQVAAVTKGQPLTPIAQLDTERTVVTLTDGDGTVVAEVADDVVTARRLRGSSSAPLRWREIEVEVPVAAPDLQRAAADLLSDAGARPAGHGSKLARVLTETT